MKKFFFFCLFEESINFLKFFLFSSSARVRVEAAFDIPKVLMLRLSDLNKSAFSGKLCQKIDALIPIRHPRSTMTPIIKILSSFKAFFNAPWWIESKAKAICSPCESITARASEVYWKDFFFSRWKIIIFPSNNVILMKRKFQYDIVWLMICMIYSGLLGGLGC